MPTYEGIAKELGVSKQTVRNWVRRIDPDGAHIDRSGDTHVLDAELASMVAHEISKRLNNPEHVQARKAREAMASVVEVSETEIERLRKHYEEILRIKDETAAAMLEEKDARIADLKEQVAQLSIQLAQERDSHEVTRRDLALSRELEGFKWPWQRKEIRERYALLPEKTGEQG